MCCVYCVALPDTEEEGRLSEVPSASFHQWHGKAGGGEARRQAGAVHGQPEVSSA